MASSYPITGVPGPVSVRPEISSWSISGDRTDKIQVSLFIRALLQLQEKDTLTDELSFYRLAGIHGLPAQSWDGDQNPPPYCTHNKVTFPTWHRPYVLVYEQSLYNIMIQTIESGITDPNIKKEWTIAANKWRLPFWDWALKQADTKEFGVPGIVKSSTVEILKLGKTEKEIIVNPLHKFTNKLRENGKLVEVPMGDPKMGQYAIKYNSNPNFNKCIGTSRYGIFASQPPEKWIRGINNDERVGASLEHPDWGGEATGSIAHNVYRLLSEKYFRSYEPFASTIYQSQHNATEYLSLEMIHNNIHVWTGGFNANDPKIGDGQMTHVPVAAFDPIFWLHHNNVDRLLAIWQFLNKEKWFDNPFPGDPKPTDPLPPFHRDTHSTLYNSDDTRSWEKLGYTYPELINTTPQHVAELIRQKYGIGIDHLAKAPEHGIKVPGVESESFSDYVVNVEYDRYALEGEPYIIHFYLDQPQGNLPSKILNLGSVYNFSSPLELSDNASCDNCKSQKKSGVRSKAQVPITIPLFNLAADTNYPHFSNMNSDYVEVLLQDQLRWRVLTVNGEESEAIPGLLVCVHGAQAQYPTQASPLSVFDPSAYRPLYGATHGKPAGTNRPPSQGEL